VFQNTIQPVVYGAGPKLANTAQGPVMRFNTTVANPTGRHEPLTTGTFGSGTEITSEMAMRAFLGA
jgi:hypothetical protein